MNVLAIAPHPDDESIGCGGALALHAARGDRVSVVFLTSGEVGLKHVERSEAWRVREAEAARAAEVLGIASIHFLRCPDWYLADHVASAAAGLRPVIALEMPTTIYVPHLREWHPDHRAALPILSEAVVGTGIISTQVFGYEVWTPLAEYTEVRDITPVMVTKLRAVRCHESQMRGFRYDRAIRGLNAYRGEIAARTRYAEVFERVSMPETSSPDDEGFA
jgi:N-acetylglucosamine malate deacetylase 1